MIKCEECTEDGIIYAGGPLCVLHALEQLVPKYIEDHQDDPLTGEVLTQRLHQERTRRGVAETEMEIDG